VDHAFALEVVDDAPELGGEVWVVRGGDVQPLGDGVLARVWW